MKPILTVSWHHRSSHSLWIALCILESPWVNFIKIYKEKVRFVVDLNVFIIKFKKGKYYKYFSHSTSMCLSLAVEAPHTSKRVTLLSKEDTVRERSWSSSPDHQPSVMTEVFITEENIGKMENILDIWSNNLKVSLHFRWRPWNLFCSVRKSSIFFFWQSNPKNLIFIQNAN